MRQVFSRAGVALASIGLATVYTLLPAPTSILASALADPPPASGNPFPDPTASPLPGDHTGSDGVVLQQVPLDVRSRCNMILLRGSERFAQWGFLMPRAYVSMNRYHQDLFSLTKAPGGGYLLRFGLYFPKDNQDRREADALGASPDERGTCGLDQLLKEANESLDPGERKLEKLTTLPVSRIRVSVAGVANPFVFGGDDVAVLNYAGRDMIAEFHLPTDAAKDEFLNRLRDEVGGLPIRIDLVFTARASAGFAKIHIDAKQLADQVGGMLGAKAGDPLGTLVSAIRLQGALQQALIATNAALYAEEGASDKISVLAGTILQSVMTGQTGIGYPGTGWCTTLGCGNWGGPSSGSGGWGGGGWGGSGGGWSGGGWGGSDPGTGSGGTGTSGGVGIDLNAFLAKLRNMGTADIKINTLAQKSFQTYSDSISVRADFGANPGKLVDVSTVDGPERLTDRVDAANPFYIYPVQSRTLSLKTQTTKAYFNKQDLREAKMDQYSKILQGVDFDRRVHELNWTQGKVAAIDEAEGAGKLFNTRYHVFGGLKVAYSYANPLVTPIAAESLKAGSVPVKVSFSNLGGNQSFSLDQLATNRSSLWKARFDEDFQRIVVQPLADLGRMTLSILPPSTELKTIFALRFFEEIWDSANNRGAIEAQNYTVAGAKKTLPEVESTVRLRIVPVEAKPVAPGDAPGLIPLMPAESRQNFLSVIQSATTRQSQRNRNLGGP